MNMKIFLQYFWMQFITQVSCIILPPIDVIASAMDQLQISYKTIHLDLLTDNNKRVELIKKISYEGFKINFNSNDNYNDQFVILLADTLDNINWDNWDYGLVVTKIQNGTDLSKIRLRIDRNIYFLDKISFKLYETYSINGFHTKRYLGQFQTKSNTTCFKPAYKFTSSLVKRRGNFKGILLDGMIDKEHPYVDFPEDLATIAPYFPNNETYDTTKIAWGLYIDILHSLENSLNFTTNLYTRKDRRWGIPKLLPNGSETIYGMLESVAKGSADFVWASAYIGPERSRYVKFLPPLSTHYNSIFITSEDTFESVDWKLYTKHFSVELWLMILSMSVIISIIIFFIHWTHLKKILVNSILTISLYSII